MKINGCSYKGNRILFSAINNCCNTYKMHQKMPFPNVERGFSKPHRVIYIKLRNDTMAISASSTAKLLAMLVHKMQITRWKKFSN